MGTKQVTVLARLRAREGMEERVERELLALVAPSRGEGACISYDLHRGTEDKSLFMFFENWSSGEALKEHLEKPYLKSLREKAHEILAGPIEVTLWEKVG